MTQRGEATRARLIEATRSVVREVGYAHASTRAIAQAAGVAEGTIYRHFPDKASLFLTTVLEANAAVVARVSTLPQRAGEDTVEANLTDALMQLAALQEQIVPLELAILSDPELAAQRRAALAAGPGLPPGPPDAIAAYLAAEQHLGRVRADVDPVEAAIVVLATLFGLGATPSPGGSGLEPDRLRALVRLLLRGIAATGPATGPA